MENKYMLTVILIFEEAFRYLRLSGGGNLDTGRSYFSFDKTDIKGLFKRNVYIRAALTVRQLIKIRPKTRPKRRVHCH